jgi:hypothetical protein
VVGTVGVLELRPSIKAALCEGCSGSRKAKSVCERVAGLVSGCDDTTGVVELRPPLAVRRLRLPSSDRASGCRELAEGGGRLRSSACRVALVDLECGRWPLVARRPSGARGLDS